uniref:Movement protein n=1 Tax=Citrullus ophiovirus TaxID=2983936 RepID=A0A9N6YJP9_9VIRU|nr:TPA_asm: movement protein [Citrullus ophiovirus]
MALVNHESRMTRMQSNRRIKAKDLADYSLKPSEINVISLKDGGALPEGIEELTFDFCNMAKGVIKTAVVPMVMKLKKEETEKKLTMATMKKVIEGINSLMGKTSKEFVRFLKIQFMYIPLFQRGKEDNGKVKFALLDEGREESGRDPVIQEVTIDAGEMALVELSMNFFVRKDDMDKIKINIMADDVPISGRSYAALNVAFFAQEESIPLRCEQKKTTVLYIDDVACPVDLNKKTIFKSLGDRVSEEVKRKKKEYKRMEIENRRNERRKELKKRDNTSISTKESQQHENYKDSESSSSDDVISLIEQARKSTSMIPRFLKSVPIKEKRTITVPTTDDVLTMLDTGSGSHYFYCSSIQPDGVDENVGGVANLEYELATGFIVTFGNRIELGEVRLYSDDSFASNVLSFSKLKESGIIDKMRDEGDNTYLEKEGEIVMMFDSSEPGRVWLKDNIWNEITENGNMSANQYSAYMSKKGLRKSKSVI